MAEHTSRKPVTVLAVTSKDCNMECSYCYRDHSSESILSFERFERYMLNIHSYFSKDTPLSVIFHGGEPLLAGYEFFESAFDFLGGLDRKIHKSIQSNIILADERTIDLFRANSCGFGTSLDGDEEINDITRKTKTGDGSYKQTVRKLQQLNAADMPTGVISVLQENNMNAERYYDFAKNIEAAQISFCPMFEYKNSISSSANVDKLGEFLLELFDLWVADTDNPPKFTFFEGIMRSLLGHNPRKACTFVPDCYSDMVAVDVNGDVYTCTHFFGQEKYSFGNALTMPFEQIWNSANRVALRRRSENIATECGGCKYFSICHGGCMAHTINSLDEKDFFCDAYKMLFEHIDACIHDALNT